MTFSEDCQRLAPLAVLMPVPVAMNATAIWLAALALSTEEATGKRS